MCLFCTAGFESPSWFDLLTLDANGPEDETGIKKVNGINLHSIPTCLLPSLPSSPPSLQSCSIPPYLPPSLPPSLSSIFSLQLVQPSLPLLPPSSPLPPCLPSSPSSPPLLSFLPPFLSSLPPSFLLLEISL